jgi:hypothetical protein
MTVGELRANAEKADVEIQHLIWQFPIYFAENFLKVGMINSLITPLGAVS